MTQPRQSQGEAVLSPLRSTQGLAPRKRFVTATDGAQCCEPTGLLFQKAQAMLSSPKKGAEKGARRRKRRSSDAWPENNINNNDVKIFSAPANGRFERGLRAEIAWICPFLSTGSDCF